MADGIPRVKISFFKDIFLNPFLKSNKSGILLFKVKNVKSIAKSLETRVAIAINVMPPKLKITINEFPRITNIVFITETFTAIFTNPNARKAPSIKDVMAKNIMETDTILMYIDVCSKSSSGVCMSIRRFLLNKNTLITIKAAIIIFKIIDSLRIDFT